MLTKEENEAITRTGPGTPMGKLFREYWMPAVLSSELPAPDCDPVRVLLLSEKLIAFRDTNGQVGLIADSCPHRGASLFFGRNEECGLRCVYHGWKFDASGNCVDMPNEPAESNFKHKVKATAYPCQERNGLVWAYLGPRETPPPLPDLEANMLPGSRWFIQAYQMECNYLNGMEGDFDTSHASFLHSGSLKLENLTPGTFPYYMARDKAPRYAVVDTPGGVMYAGYRAAEPGQTYYRIAQFILPAVSMTPIGVLGNTIQFVYTVPMDDTHTLRIAFGIRDEGAPRDRNFNDDQFKFLPNTTEWLGRFRLALNSTNDYGIDREKQRRNEEYTGIRGIILQDQAITESQGGIYDRSTEHLGTSDTAIIQVRRRMLAAAAALERGVVPPGVDNPEVYGVRSGGIILPDEANWVESTMEQCRAFVERPDIEDIVAREKAAVPRRF